MIDQDYESIIVNELSQYTECTVVLANQTAPMPPYPYISYTIITPVRAVGGTYCDQKSGVLYQPMEQTWSFTVQSDDSRLCRKKAMLLYDFFARAGRDKIGKNGIAVAGKTDLTSRDNLLTIQFEYRNGMDVTFRMMHTIPLEEPTIESVSINGKWNIKK